jgi:hypothetical protein
VGNVEVDGIQMGMYLNGSSSGSPALNLIFKNDSFKGPDFYIRDAQNVQVIGGEVCCSGGNGVPTPTVGNGGTGQPRVSNIVIDGVNFHDITRDNTPTEHDECLFIQGVSHITVKNSRFSNCAIMDIYLHGISGEQNPDDVHLLNNDFGPMGSGIDSGYYAVQFRADSGETINGFEVRGNAFGQPMNIENAAGSSVSGVTICNNTGSGWSSLSPLTLGAC